MNFKKAGLPIKYCYVPYIEDPKHGKSRPCLVLRQNKKVADILPITSKYRHKPKHIKMWYFKIRNWRKAGLKHPSYIDLSGQQPINSKYMEHHVKGYLSQGACMHMFSKGIYLNRTRANILDEVRGNMLKIRNNKALRQDYSKHNSIRDTEMRQEKRYGIKFRHHHLVLHTHKPLKITHHYRKHRRYFHSRKFRKKKMNMYYRHNSPSR